MSNSTINQTKSKFQLGDKVKINDVFKQEYKQICDNWNWNFNERIKKYNKIWIVQDIYSDGIHDTIIWFDKVDKNGSHKEGLSEKFLQRV